MKRILHIIPYVYFYPPKTGGQLRCFHLMDQLAKKYVIDVISFLPENGLTKYGYHNKNITFYSPSTFKYKKKLFDFLPKKIAVALKYRWWQKTLKGPAEAAFIDFFPIMKELYSKNKYEFVVFEHLSSMLLGKVSKKIAPNTIRIIDQHNVDHFLYKETSHNFNNKRYARLLALESSLRIYADAFFVCSEQDKITLTNLNNSLLPGFVIPNGTLLKDNFASTERYNLKKMIFCGSLDYAPNINGLLWFFSKVWPGLKQKVKGIELTIIGRNGIDPRYDKLKSDKQINFVGEVDNVTPHYQKNNIAIIPLLEGSGTRLKILEAMAHGNPVISTAIGADGINYTNLENIIIADTSNEFENIIKTEFESQTGLLAKVVRNSLTLIKNNYTWDKIGKRIQGVLDNLEKKDNG